MGRTTISGSYSINDKKHASTQNDRNSITKSRKIFKKCKKPHPNGMSFSQERKKLQKKNINTENPITFKTMTKPMGKHPFIHISHHNLFHTLSLSIAVL